MTSPLAIDPSAPAPGVTAPIVIDLDGSVGAFDGEIRLPLDDWQEAIRFGCGWRSLRAFDRVLAAQLPRRHGSVFTGSGDFHHLTYLLVRRLASCAPFRVLVFDNHPDNMRYLFGIHCGSWVRYVARLPWVARVDVVGITSPDIGARHAWENYLGPLRAGRVNYWSVGVDTRWASRLRLGAAMRSFDSTADMIARLHEELRLDTSQIYLSIDKDVLHPEVVHTNWDQGVLREAALLETIDLLRGRLVGSDITGDISSYRYRGRWKRWLSRTDGQMPIAHATLVDWQAQQHALNKRLLARLAQAG
jgi:hypothetical protein